MKTIKVIFAIIIASISPNLLADNFCGEIKEDAYDYTSFNPRIRGIEAHHFNKDVENLISGMTASIGSDINYLLVYVPNHHRALMAMTKLAARDKTNKPRGARYSVLCYFERAIRFKPDDALVRSLFSSYLLQIGQSDMAMEQLKVATELDPNNPMSNYNLGLLYFKKKKYDQAYEYAKKAYSLDFPLPGLKNKLIKVGKWKN